MKFSVNNSSLYIEITVNAIKIYKGDVYCSMAIWGDETYDSIDGILIEDMKKVSQLMEFIEYVEGHIKYTLESKIGSGHITIRIERTGTPLDRIYVMTFEYEGGYKTIRCHKEEWKRLLSYFRTLFGDDGA